MKMRKLRLSQDDHQPKRPKTNQTNHPLHGVLSIQHAKPLRTDFYNWCVDSIMKSYSLSVNEKEAHRHDCATTQTRCVRALGNLLVKRSRCGAATVRHAEQTSISCCCPISDEIFWEKSYEYLCLIFLILSRSSQRIFFKICPHCFCLFRQFASFPFLSYNKVLLAVHFLNHDTSKYTIIMLIPRPFDVSLALR